MWQSCQHLYDFLSEAAQHPAGDTKHPNKTETEAGCEVMGKSGILVLWRWENTEHVFMLNRKIQEGERLMKQEKDRITAGEKYLSGREDMGSRRQGQKLVINRMRDTCCTVMEEKGGYGILIQISDM